MIGAGTVINPIIKIVTTVAILAAVGFFIVRPILDTTNKAIDSAGDQIRRAQQQSNHQSAQMDVSFDRSRATSYESSLQSSWPAAARHVHSCVQAADAAGAGMGRCAELGERIVHSVQSDRSFALSYAESLAAQGRGDDARRVRDCVKRAGFKPAAMQRCNALADRLLFG